MNAIRNIYKVQNNQVIIDLPKSFDYKSVEVIIMPVFDNKDGLKKINNISKSERLNNLLSISVWNESDINQIIESQNYINQWKIEEF